MAAFVESVERFSLQLRGSSLPLTDTANLTKGQDLSQCVAFCTANCIQTSSAMASLMNAVRIFDDAGTKKIEASKNNNRDADVEACVIEFKSSVTVQSGGWLQLTSTSVTQNISAVNQNNAFIIFSYRAISSSSADDWNDALVQAKFNSDTQIQFSRRAGGSPDIEIQWYVVESNGTDFQTEYLEFDTGTNDTTLTRTLSNTVDLDHAFLVASYETSETSNDVRDGISNMALTATDTLTWYRNHGSTPSATNTIGVWVVRGTSSEFTVQRFATDVGASSATANQTITAVDLDKAAIFSGQNIGMGTWPISSNTSSTGGAAYQTHLSLTSTTNVQLVRNTSSSISGSNNFIRYEVVEFELESTGPQTIPVGLVEETDTVLAVTPVITSPPQTIVVGLVEETDSVLAVTPVPGAVSVSVDLVSETDTVLAVTPEIGAPAQTVPVGLISETDSVLAVTPVAGEVTVPVGIVAEVDSVLPVTPVPGTVSVPVEIVSETDLIAPVFPVVAGGPQTVLVVNVAEIDTVFEVTPRLGPEDEIKGGIPPEIRKPRRRARRYILPDGRVFTDPERALYELREMLRQEQQQAAQQEPGGALAPLEPEPASLGQGRASPGAEPSEISPRMLQEVLDELPEMILARGEGVAPLDPQLISVLFEIIDDEEAAILLL